MKIKIDIEIPCNPGDKYCPRNCPGLAKTSSILGSSAMPDPRQRMVAGTAHHLGPSGARPLPASSPRSRGAWENDPRIAPDLSTGEPRCQPCCPSFRWGATPHTCDSWSTGLDQLCIPAVRARFARDSAGLDPSRTSAVTSGAKEDCRIHGQNVHSKKCL